MAMVGGEEEAQLSKILGLKGCRDSYDSIDEFKQDLNEDGLVYEKFGRGLSAGRWVLWREDDSSADELHANIMYFLGELTIGIEDCDHTFNLGEYLVQFWAPQEVEGRLGLTTSGQPFALGYTSLKKGYCWYRRHSRDHVYFLDKEEELGPPGRVFRSGQPESSPDLRLYSTTEHPLRDYAAYCGLRPYLALPLFDRQSFGMTNHMTPCLGVLEIVALPLPWTFILRPSNWTTLETALKAAGLRSTHIYSPLTRTELPSEISEMLELAIQKVPQLHLAQVWAKCKQCDDGRRSRLNCMERAAFIDFRDKKINLSLRFDCEKKHFVGANQLHQVQFGKGTAGRLLSSTVISSCLCLNICAFSITEYPLAHYAQKARLSCCFAICLQSVHNKNALYVFEFFFQPLSRVQSLAILSNALQIMVAKLEKSFQVASGKKLREKQEVEVLVKSTQMGSFQLDRNNISSLHEYETPTQFISSSRNNSTEGFTSTIMVVDPENDIVSALPTRLKGCGGWYSIDEFKKYLEEPQLTWSQPVRNKPTRLFWNSKHESTNNNSSSSFRCQIQERILALLGKITFKKSTYFIAQYWAPSEDGSYLTASGHPFSVGSLRKGLCWYRKQCTDHYGQLGGKDKMIGPVERAFKNGHPESTQDLRLYSDVEFPLRQDALRCGLKGYAVLPVFDLQTQCCIGVLEFAAASKFTQYLYSIERALKAARLRSTHIKLQRCSRGWLKGDWALCRIDDVLQLASGIPEFSAAVAWVPCQQCPNSRHNLSCWQIAGYRRPSHEYIGACKFHGVQIGMGIVGRAVASKNKTFYCRNLCDLGTVDNPSAHYALQDRFNACFAICLQSSETYHDKLYVIEFFLSPGSPATFFSFLHYLLPIMKQKLKNFKVASEQQLGGTEELVIDVLESYEGDHGLFISNAVSQHDNLPIRFEIVKYGHGMTQPQPHLGGDQLQAHDFTTGGGDSFATDHIAWTGENVMTETANQTQVITSDMDVSGTNASENDKNNITATTIEQGAATNRMKRGTKRVSFNFRYEDLEMQQYGIPGNFVVRSLGGSSTETDTHDIGYEQAHLTTDVTAYIAENEENIITISDEEVAPKKARKNGSLNITYEDLKPHFGKKLKLVAEELRVGKSTIKRACREFGITRWPSNDKYRKNTKLFEKATTSEVVGTSKQPISISNELIRNGEKEGSISKDLNPSIENLPIVPQSATEATMKHSQTTATVPESDYVMVKATFDGKTIKLPLPLSSSLEELMDEIAKRHKLRPGSFELEYLDEDEDWILLDCDAALHLCVKTLTSLGKTPIRMRVQSMNK